MFHGTQAAFDAFDMGMLGVNTPLAVSKLGAFFSGTRTSPRALYARMDHSKPGRVITAFLALRNPAVIGAAEFYSHVTPDQVESLRTRLLASGHDGIIVKGGRKFHNADHFVAFEAAQIHIVQTCAAQPVRSRTGPGASAVLARAWIDSQEPPSRSHRQASARARHHDEELFGRRRPWSHGANS